MENERIDLQKFDLNVIGNPVSLIGVSQWVHHNFSFFWSLTPPPASNCFYLNWKIKYRGKRNMDIGGTDKNNTGSPGRAFVHDCRLCLTLSSDGLTNKQSVFMTWLTSILPIVSNKNLHICPIFGQHFFPFVHTTVWLAHRRPQHVPTFALDSPKVSTHADHEKMIGEYRVGKSITSVFSMLLLW